MSHIHSTENLVFERLQEHQRLRNQRGQRAPRRIPSRHLIGSLGAFFIAMGTKLQKIEQHSEHPV